MFTSPQMWNGETSIYHTEHIIELQTIPRFIESATKTRNERRDPKPIELTKTVGIEFFKRQFKKGYPARVRGRPDPPTDLAIPNPPNRSIMDNVFEALGSQSNPQVFVLCERGINSVKQKLWANFQPANVAKIQEIAEDAADGSIPSNEHLSAMRVVLGVYEYMEVVKNKMENEIKNVKTELGNKNIEHIVRDKKEMPQDKDGNIVDLGDLWQEYMDKLLLRFMKRGVEWLEIQIKWALPLYTSELERLQKYIKDLEKEDAEPNSTTRRKLRNERNEKRDTYMEKLTALERELTSAKDDQRIKNQKFNEVVKQIPLNQSKQKQNEKKEELRFFEFKKASDAADNKAYQAQKKVGLMTRQIHQLDRKELAVLIKNVEDDIAQLKAYEKVVKTLRTNLEDEELDVQLKYATLGV